MTTDDAPSLAAQREEIRDRMRAQRQRIALELRPATPAQNVFPRSFTMRLLMRRPELVGSVLRLASRLIRPVRTTARL